MGKCLCCRCLQPLASTTIVSSLRLWLLYHSGVFIEHHIRALSRAALLVEPRPQSHLRCCLLKLPAHPDTHLGEHVELSGGPRMPQGQDAKHLERLVHEPRGGEVGDDDGAGACIWERALTGHTME